MKFFACQHAIFFSTCMFEKITYQHAAPFPDEHAALVNSMITPSIADKTKTIFEAVWDVIPNIDLVPPIGCFCARLMDNSAREDWKLDPKNQSGVFLGFAHRRNIYGAQIL